MDGADNGAGSTRHAKTAIALAVAELAGKLASFVMFLVAARKLGPTDFGEFSWSFTLALTVASFAVWGFDVAVIQKASRDPDRLDELLTSSLGLRLAISCLALVVMLAIPSGGVATRPVTLVIGLAVLLDTANQSIRASAAVLQRQRSVAVSLVFQRLATAAIAIAVLLAGGSVFAMACAYLAGTLIGVVLMFVTGHRVGLRPSARHLSRERMWELLTASHAMGLSNTLNMLVFRMDAILLGWMTSAAVVGAYAAAYKLFETALFAVWSLASVSFPVMAATEGDDVVRRGVHRTVGAMAAVYVPYCLILGLRSQQVLGLLFGAEYGRSSVVSLQILLLALIPYGLQYLLAGGLRSRAWNIAVTAGATVAVVVNLVANLVLIPQFGAGGAAAATLLAMVVQATMLWIILRRRIGNMRLFRAAAVPLLSGVAIVPVLISPLPLVPALILAGVVYCCVWMLAAGRWDQTSQRTVLSLMPVLRKGMGIRGLT